MNEIEILEKVAKGLLTDDEINRRLLILYGVKRCYFYHYSFYSSYSNGRIVSENELVECDEVFYNNISSKSDNLYYQNPVTYMSDEIPTNKKIRKILYKK